MPTTKQAVAAIVRHIGLDEGRVGAVARALTDDSVLPPGAPGKSPDLSPQDVASLMLGAALDVPLRAVADAVATYRELTPAGTPIDVLPASLQYAAGNFLDGLADYPENARHLRIEVVSTWREITIHYADGSTRRFVEPGADASRWQSNGHRRSTVINGAAFADAVRDLFGGK